MPWSKGFTVALIVFICVFVASSYKLYKIQQDSYSVVAWIDYNNRCSWANYNSKRDSDTFYASYNLLRYLGTQESLKGLSIRKFGATGNKTICVGVIAGLDQIDPHAINASFEKMAKAICEASARFLESDPEVLTDYLRAADESLLSVVLNRTLPKKERFKVFVQFWTDTSRDVDGTHYIDESLIQNVTQSCDNLAQAEK